MASPKEKIDIESIIANGMTAMLIGIGFNVGLWDTLSTMDEKFTSEALAKSAKLNKRYVEEWLGSMVASNIIDVDDKEKYSLKIDVHEIVQNHLRLKALPLFGSKTPDIERCIKSEEPIGYTLSDFPAFMKFMDEFHIQKYSIEWMKDTFNEVFQKLPENPKVLDFGCGTGILTALLSKHYPSSTIYGIDQSQQALEHCKKHYNQSNIVFLLTEGSLPSDWTDTFDLVVLADVLHDLSDPVSVLSEVKRVIKRSGFVISVDPEMTSGHQNFKGNRHAILLSFFSLMNCLPSSMASAPHAGLGACWGYENKIKFLKEHGCEIVHLSETEKKQGERVTFKAKK